MCLLIKAWLYFQVNFIFVKKNGSWPESRINDFTKRRIGFVNTVVIFSDLSQTWFPDSYFMSHIC